MKRLRATVAVFVALQLPVGHALAADPSITDIRPVALHPGVNTVPGFGVNGETFTIIQAWRGNGNAHGYSDWLVLAPRAEGHPAGVVGLDRGHDVPSDLIRDDPFDGERVMGTIVFAKARIDGAPCTIVIDTHLDTEPDKPFADHDRATIRVYQLTHADSVGSTPDLFTLVATVKTTKRYCNAALALHQTLGVPLAAADYAGPNMVDGCF